MALFPDIVRAPIEVAPGYALPVDIADLYGWAGDEDTLYTRIVKGIDYCRTHNDDAARDLLCILCLTYEERFAGLPEGIEAQLTALTKEAA